MCIFCPLVSQYSEECNCLEPTSHQGTHLLQKYTHLPQCWKMCLETNKCFAYSYNVNSTVFVLFFSFEFFTVFVLQSMLGQCSLYEWQSVTYNNATIHNRKCMRDPTKPHNSKLKWYFLKTKQNGETFDCRHDTPSLGRVE